MATHSKQPAEQRLIKATNRRHRREIAAFLKKTYDPYDPKSNVIDILTDLRHYCDSQGYDFADADRTAYQHYLVEKAELRKVAS